MNLLAIDTALEACSVGVVAGERVVLRSEVVDRAHQVRLFPIMKEAMAEAGIAFDALDRIGVTVGPGSFTGIRIGVAAARGLALVTKAPVVGVTTLEIHAEAAAADLSGHPLLVVLPARGDLLYAQLFAADLAPLGPPRVAAVGELAAETRAANAMLAGSAADMIANMLGDGGAARIIHRNSAPDVAALVRVVLRAPISDQAPKPLYLRPPDAALQPNRAVARQ